MSPKGEMMTVELQLEVYVPEIDQQDLYDIKALPTLYLLDAQKRVTLKDVQVEKVINHHFWAGTGKYFSSVASRRL